MPAQDSHVTSTAIHWKTLYAIVGAFIVVASALVGVSTWITSYGERNQKINAVVDAQPEIKARLDTAERNVVILQGQAQTSLSDRAGIHQEIRTQGDKSEAGFTALRTEIVGRPDRTDDKLDKIRDRLPAQPAPTR